MSAVDVSVILPFRDHEDKIGNACHNLADYFRAHNLSFEILAVDTGSGDNSQTVLALLRRELPELRVMVGSGYGVGSQAARAKVLVLARVESVEQSVATSLRSAYARVTSSAVDMYLVAEALVVCQKDRCAKLILSSATRRAKSERELLDLAERRGLSVRSYGPLAPRSGHAVSRFLSGLMPRVAGSSIL